MRNPRRFVGAFVLAATMSKRTLGFPGSNELPGPISTDISLPSGAMKKSSLPLGAQTGFRPPFVEMGHFPPEAGNVCT